MRLSSCLPFLRCVLRGLICAAALLGTAVPAMAQLGLPPLPPLPALPSPPSATPLPAPVGPRVAPLLGQGRAGLDELLQREPHRLERDPAGAVIVRGELLLTSPSPRLLDAALAAGFALLRDERFPALELRLVTLTAPQGVETAAALDLLRRLEPQLDIDFNHLYRPSGHAATAPRPSAPTPSPGRPGPASLRVGLIDGGVQERHPSLRKASLHRHGCEGRSVPDDHATAVASLLVGEAPGVRGALPQATLYAADIYCGDPAGGTAQRVVQALDWLAAARVPVINLSLAGPPNRLLERAVGRLAAHGHLLVAAVGNDGPASPPLYPAAYTAAVIGVTAVDPRHRVLPEALRGPQVAFAALGASMRAAQGDHGEAFVRGTSFAAPWVSRLLAIQLAQPDPLAARRALEHLIAHALDLGAPGRDAVYGHGLLPPSAGAHLPASQAARGRP